MLKIEHIGIAVKGFGSSIPLFEQILNTPCYKTETVESEQVNTAFFQKGETKIIEKKGEGIHHIAFEVEDILSEMERLRAAGFTLLNEKPKKGADNKWVCFLHPKDANGVLVELCEEIR
jgi:methylmalonyl-CoA/ethylmalonyl-CoA epimerase